MGGLVGGLEVWRGWGGLGTDPSSSRVMEILMPLGVCFMMCQQVREEGLGCLVFTVV